MIHLDARAKQQFRSVMCDLNVAAKTVGADQLSVLLRKYAEAQVEVGGPIPGRLPTLERLVSMAGDAAWELPRLDRKFITATLRYLLDHRRLLFSSIESKLLEASAIDLLTDDCRAELAAYEEFCSLRDAGDCKNTQEVRTRKDWLRFKREALQKAGKRSILGMRRSRRIG